MKDKLLALEIPLPPIAEQKRMAVVERARAAAEAQIAAATPRLRR
jgi:hypothetical protein